MTTAGDTLPWRRFFRRKPRQPRPKGGTAAQPWTWPAAVFNLFRRPEFMLRVAAALIFIIPGQLVVPRFSDFGRPSLVIGLVMAVWWLMCSAHPAMSRPGSQPLRWAMLMYIGLLLLSYGAGHLRGMHPLEANAADRFLIITVALAGLMLAIADGVDERAGLDRILKTLVLAATFAAIIGILQAFFKIDFAAEIRVPGLIWQGGELTLQERGKGLFRVASTSLHYIEFSVIMAMAAFLGLHYARFSESFKQKALYAACTVLCATAVPLSLSRTGIVGLGVALLTLLPMWSRRVRINMIVIVTGFTLSLSAVKPGLLASLTSLFFAGEDDLSITARLSDYDYMFKFFAQRPLFGRGTGTFLPVLYDFIDNFWLMFLVTNGVVGVIGLVALHGIVFVQGQVARRRPHVSERDRDLIAVLMSAVMVSIAVSALFDSFSFTSFTMTWAIELGAIGAMWRFTRDPVMPTVMADETMPSTGAAP